MSSTKVFLLLSSILLAAKVSMASDHFLKTHAANDLLGDVEAILGPGTMRARVDSLQRRLAPMFEALPKNHRGLLNHATARYALYRINVELHGWRITGLEPSMTNFNTTSIVFSGILSDIFPPHLEHTFVDHLLPGLGLKEVSILAATIEHLVHEAQKAILQAGSHFFDIPTIGPISQKQLDSVLELYFATFLSNYNVSEITELADAQYVVDEMADYPGWEDSKTLIADETKSLVFIEQDVANPFVELLPSFDLAIRTVGQLADRYHSHQSQPECMEIKEDLLAYEQNDNGKVSLVDFYRAGLNARFYYIESEEYLRAMGALDESDRKRPSVIVTNYILGKTNCIASSPIYSVCCVNECDALLGQVENHVAASEATPRSILDVVTYLSSSTVQAPRNLSSSLINYLDQIKTANSGTVFLHGRLFAQWMHLAFPRECPYPHAVGTTTSLQPDEWGLATGNEFRFDHEIADHENRSHHLVRLIDEMATNEQNESSGEEHKDVMWSFEEERFVASDPSSSWPIRYPSSQASIFIILLAVSAVKLAGSYQMPLMNSKRQKTTQNWEPTRSLMV